MDSESKSAIAQPIIRHSWPLVKWYHIERASEIALSPVRFVNEYISLQGRVSSLSLPRFDPSAFCELRQRYSEVPFS